MDGVYIRFDYKDSQEMLYVQTRLGLVIGLFVGSKKLDRVVLQQLRRHIYMSKGGQQRRALRRISHRLLENEQMYSSL